MQSFQRLWKPLLAIVAVGIAFTVTLIWPRENGLDLDIDGSPRAQAAQSREPYDLTRTAVLQRVVLEVKEHYVEPARMRPQRMLLAGLNAVQRFVAPVLVGYEEGKAELTFQVGEHQKSFRVDDVNSPWKLTERYKEIFGFLQSNLEDEELDLREVEYAAVNGMLRTLDPHSVLLTPDVFEEMQMSTRGEFGGLGIVISLRDGHLTIIRPMEDTPASEAGLRRYDRIVKIGDESTLNMPLSEAVDRLRGAPGSRVVVWVRRKNGRGNWGQPRRFELVRAVIHIQSVEHEMLEAGVGYIKIRSFQGNTFEDMKRALSELHRQRLRSLILDLRDDPGGLLEQAVLVTDTFLSSGTIVTTSSNDPTQRDEKFARAEGTEPNYPMVVLINGGSASASEIVAGALKNHDRALVIGERSFGKGSVQVLYNFRDGSALKLTIAQYLTPGDVSIQSVGILPDISIDPMTVDREDMDLMMNRDFVRESDLRSHLTHERAREHGADKDLLRYYLPPEVRQRLREASPDEREENEKEAEFLTAFSQNLLARAERSGRQAMLEDAQEVIKETGRAEMRKAEAELRRLGVDWGLGDNNGASSVQVELSTNMEDNRARAGESFELQIALHNRGEHPLYQLRAETESDNPLFDNREFVFGRLDPGETRSWSTTLGLCETEEDRRVCRIPPSLPDRADGIRVKFHEAYDRVPPDAEIRTHVEALERPQFAYSVQVADPEGNGDGHVQPGERVSVYLQLRNLGRGKAFDAQANLRNITGRGILLRAARFDLDTVEPGASEEIIFTFDLLPDFDEEEATLEISVLDLDLRESMTERLTIPIHSSRQVLSDRTGFTTLPEGTSIRTAPDPHAQVFARVRDGSTELPIRASTGDLVRVDIGDGRPGWVLQSELGSMTERSESRGSGSVEILLNHMPPQLDLNFDNVLVTRSDTVRLSGEARDDQQIRDLYIYAGARKVFYQSNTGSRNRRQTHFDAEVPLSGGINYITVFVRESDEVMSRKTIVVRRDDAEGGLMETPRFEDSAFGDHVELLP